MYAALRPGDGAVLRLGQGHQVAGAVGGGEGVPGDGPAVGGGEVLAEEGERPIRLAAVEADRGERRAAGGGEAAALTVEGGVVERRGREQVEVLGSHRREHAVVRMDARQLAVVVGPEHGQPDAAGSVDSFWNGIWWSFTTVITGGFGDIHNPCSAPARVLTVLLVILGTYCLFTAGSIALLKLLRRNKKYYYETRHFIPVSGMIYRMKQNAVGLANICILATMVLVMVSGTVCLYLGTEDALYARYPTEIAVNVGSPTGNARENLYKAAEKAVSDSGLEMTNVHDYISLGLFCTRNGNDFGDGNNIMSNNKDSVFVVFVPESEYEHITDEKSSLASDEAFAFSDRQQFGDSFLIFGKEYKITRRLDDFPMDGHVNSVIMDYCLFVVSDETFEDMSARETENSPLWYLGFDVDGTAEQKIACRDAVDNAIGNALISENGEDLGSYEYARTECREADREYFYTLNGGFLFLGLFLGLVFLIATVLIIYYKQLSEGYDDKERFEIMQKVGISHPEIKKAIHSQILIVFFLPLLMAVVHIAFAFKMITKLLLVLNLTNVTLFAICTLCTVAVFAVIYGIVYLLTAKVYYKLVS